MIYGINVALPVFRVGVHIVDAASLTRFIPFLSQSFYCATKYAVVRMSKSMRYEFVEEGIHFSVTYPVTAV
jgi:short-subunit dehydrogenase